MSELINGRTPEEIKRNLSHLVRCEICPQNHEYGCDYENRTKECQTTDDVLALIERLESERDAALAKVRNAPAIDAAPVVRCNDCMKRSTFECPMYRETDGSDYGLGIIINDRTDDDGYCHCGARMDGKSEEER